MYQVDPFGSRKPILLHEFNETSAITGIVETSPDIFHVSSAGTSYQNLLGTGKAYIFRVDMRNFSEDRTGSATVTKVASVPQAHVLDGLTFLGGNSSILLASDLSLGVIHSIDFRTGETRIAINSTYTRAALGPNGIKYHDNFLYFTNVDQQTLVKVAVNSRGEAIGNYTILAQGGFEPDDFTFDALGGIYLADSDSGIIFVPQGGGNVTQIATMAGATSCAFGRTAADRDLLYVTTNGGIEAYEDGKSGSVSGKVLSVKVVEDTALSPREVSHCYWECTERNRGSECHKCHL